MYSAARVGTALTSASVCAVGGAFLFGDEGTKRSITFWGNIFPVYLHYRTYQFLNRDIGLMSDEYATNQYDVLHEKYSEKVKSIVYGMRGFYLKNAQVMSTQDDFVPSAYMRWVKDTQDNVPSEFKGSEARLFVTKMLKEEQGVDFETLFSDWEDKPLGVASIGQVHKAVLRKTGETVAVKLLCPGIENRFRSDIKTLRSFCQLAMPQHVSAFEEIEKQFCTEFDYTEEAKNLDVMSRAMRRDWSNFVIVPTPLTQFCSKHILVMQFLDGVKLVDGVRAQHRTLAAQTGTTIEQLEAEYTAAIASGTYKFKSIAESRAEQARIQWMLGIQDFLLTPSNWWKLCYNFSVLRLWYGPVSLQRTVPPIDLGGILELLCKVHGNQIFGFGSFNGDPHPGNILLLNDGRLGLIDYGQVKTMTREQRIIYAKLIIAHARDDKEEIIRLVFEEQGVITQKSDPQVAYLFSSFYHDRSTDDIMNGMNIASFIDSLQSRDPMVKLPEEYIFASRVSIMMRGMGKAFGLQLRISELWKSEAEAFLRSQGIEY